MSSVRNSPRLARLTHAPRASHRSLRSSLSLFGVRLSLFLSGVRRALHGLAQGVQSRLPPRPEAVDQHPGDQRPLQAGVRRRGSPVHAAVHGRGRRCRRAAVHSAQQAGVVEVRRGEHPLQGGVVSGLRQQLEPNRRLPLPLGPKTTKTHAGYLII